MHGQQIAASDKVVMWYVSGNRDPRVIEQAHQFKIDRLERDNISHWVWYSPVHG